MPDNDDDDDVSWEEIERETERNHKRRCGVFEERRQDRAYRLQDIVWIDYGKILYEFTKPIHSRRWSQATDDKWWVAFDEIYSVLTNSHLTHEERLTIVEAVRTIVECVFIGFKGEPPPGTDDDGDDDPDPSVQSFLRNLGKQAEDDGGAP